MLRAALLFFVLGLVAIVFGAGNVAGRLTGDWPNFIRRIFDTRRGELNC